MKNYLFCFLLLTFFVACHCDDDTETQTIPQCVEALYEPGSAQDTNLLSVQKMEINGEYHYWLNNGSMAFDGAEFVINEACDTVCFLCGFCGPPDCMSDYENGEWEIIWEK